MSVIGNDRDGNLLCIDEKKNIVSALSALGHSASFT